MLQLVNLLRLHLVLRIHILLPVLPTVIAGHLGHGTSWSQKQTCYILLTKYVGWPENAGKLCADVTIMVC